MDVSSKKEFLIKAAYFFTVIGLVFLIYKFLITYFFPFLIGLILAYLLQRPSEKISAKIKVKKRTVAGISAVVCYVLLVAVIGFLLMLITSKISRSADLFGGIFDSLKNLLPAIAKRLPPSVGELFINNGSFGDSFLKTFADALTELSGKIMSALPSLLLGSAITVVASFYIARDFDAVKEYIFSFLSDRKITLVKRSVKIIYENVFKLLKGYILLSGITFVILFCGFLILGIKNFVYLALLISLVDFLPVLGTGTVLIPWSVAELIRGNYTMAVSIIILYLIDCAVRNFAEPRIVGKQLGIPPLVLLILIFLGLKLFGFLGMIVAVLSLVVVVELYKQNIISL
ncbi:MAG: AI-2E family transporter [Clostridiales bacterium]|nr:AI-2E family transporter [Candidatus Equinaster intestinalis]